MHKKYFYSLQAQESTLQALAASFGQYAFSSDDAREVAAAAAKYRSEITEETRGALMQALQDINENAVWHSVRQKKQKAVIGFYYERDALTEKNSLM